MSKKNKMDDKVDQAPTQVDVTQATQEAKPTPSEGGVQTSDVIDAYLVKPLSGEIEYAESQQKIACINFLEKESVQAYLRCTLLKARDFNTQYFGAKNCVSSSFLDQACLVDENVDDYLALNEEIRAALDASLDAIKVSKDKLWAIRESACRLDACRNDNCNSEQLSAMGNIPEVIDSNDVPISGVARFHKLVDVLIEKANGLYDCVDDTFEKGVKIAGIQAYINVASLKNLSTTLKTNAEAFDADITSNLSFSEEQIQTAQQNFTDGLQAYNQCLFDKNTARICCGSLLVTEDDIENLKDVVCDKATEAKRISDLKDICEDIQATFKACNNDGAGA